MRLRLQGGGGGGGLAWHAGLLHYHCTSLACRSYPGPEASPAPHPWLSRLDRATLLTTATLLTILQVPFCWAMAAHMDETTTNKPEPTTSSAAIPSSAGNLCTFAHLPLQGRCVTLRQRGANAWLAVEQHAGLQCTTTLVAGHAACCALHACAAPHMMGACAAQAQHPNLLRLDPGLQACMCEGLPTLQASKSPPPPQLSPLKCWQPLHTYWCKGGALRNVGKVRMPGWLWRSMLACSAPHHTCGWPCWLHAVPCMPVLPFT
jgi:hypothetical protein